MSSLRNEVIFCGLPSSKTVKSLLREIGDRTEVVVDHGGVQSDFVDFLLEDEDITLTATGRLVPARNLYRYRRADSGRLWEQALLVLRLLWRCGCRLLRWRVLCVPSHVCWEASVTGDCRWAGADWPAPSIQSKKIMVIRKSVIIP